MSLPYHKLVVWQRADDLFIDIHRLTVQQFPREERFELGSQLRRSAYSVAANLVEGSARETTRDRLIAARRLGYLSEATYLEFEIRVRAVAAPLNGLIKSTKTKRTTAAAIKLGAVTIALLLSLGWF